LWLRHKDSPPHFLPAILAVLSNVLPEQWIGQGGTTGWNVRSPGFNFLDI
jgi:hypothetical protein